MKVCIVGGGTAGWMSALMMSTDAPKHEYILIESSKHPIIGVGEGSTGHFVKEILKNYNIDPVEFMKETDGLPKYGIRFKNWLGDDTWFDSALGGSYTTNETIDFGLYSAVKNEYPISWCSQPTFLSSHNLTDWVYDEKQDSNKLLSITGNTGFTYHFNAHKVGQYLKSKCQNITVIDSEVVDMEIQQGKVKSISLSNNETIEADIFVDATGFKQLFSTALEEPKVSYNEYLPVDRSFLFELEDHEEDRTPCTTAWARDNGWIFEIPTRNRIGRGYIYCSKFADDNSIHKELETIYGQTIKHVKTIQFDSYRLRNSLFGNVLSVGLSSSFFEPLQATSIHNTVVQLRKFIDNVLSYSQESTLDKNKVMAYNTFVNKLYDDTADFIGIHYTAGRQDTEFWKYVEQLPRTEQVDRIYTLAKTRMTRKEDIIEYDGIPGYALWNISMAGLKIFDKDVVDKEFEYYGIDDSVIREYLAGLEDNNNNMIKNESLLTQEQLNEVLKIV
jgi:flavin-dependent dehydrogenase